MNKMRRSMRDMHSSVDYIKPSREFKNREYLKNRRLFSIFDQSLLTTAFLCNAFGYNQSLSKVYPVL